MNTHTIEPPRFDALNNLRAPLTGAAFTALRVQAGLTIAELAAWTGKHRTTIRRMERGQQRVAPAVARRPQFAERAA